MSGAIRMDAWRVKVVTTNASKNEVETPSGYRACHDGELYIVCDRGDQVFKIFGNSVISVERIGVGYSYLHEAEGGE